jgi:hypothetical protein
MPSRVDLPITRNQKPVGTLSIIRANHWRMTGDDGRRLATPIATDQLLITITNATGERVGYFEVPMDQLPPDGGS